ncbi:N-acetylneuraminate synthase family protein [Poritiphilus flavus]|uniref:N-acetylneuraminate synthase n=1 Tax=Poritiphilus flavus TaxID=2697053 RepID=A0A6L9E893_9FLAO|nr:N-acetylneuraminate synthase family protein [Poritiphilus flavus]NAS10977.1 N-acetylneuraminate synthase [Poritiphilus flavus]
MKNNTWKGKHGPLLIAEIGGNHEGDFEYALALTRLAIDSDVDYVKFQIYSGDTLVSRLESPQRNKHFKKFELSREQYIQLAELCEAKGVKFMASVWNIDYVPWIDEFSDVYKIGSGDLTAYPVLKGFAELGKPLILSTGLSTLEEVIDAVRFIQDANARYKDPDYLAVLQCTSMYPIPFSDANLAVMASFREALGLPIGYSDHTEGMQALITSYAMGAEILEFHFTDSRENKEFRDHKVSLTKDEVLEMILEIRKIQDLKGDPLKRPLEVEGDHVISFRRAVYPSADLKKGTVLTEENLTVLRPNHGIDARDFYKLIGKRLKEDVKEHQKLNWDYIE